MNLHTFKRLLITTVLGVFGSVGAHADSPANGANLYGNSCAACHGSNPLTSNVSKIYNGRNARNVIDAAIAGNVGGMSFLRSSFPAGGTALADVAAYLGNTPRSLAFAATAVGSSSAAQTVTVYASLKGGNAISGMSFATTGDFARSGGTCATSVNTGLSCTVLVTFNPTAGGARTGTLSITHSRTSTPVAIALTGTGSVISAPVANITPSALTLAATAIGATSAAMNVNVSNTGNADLSISTINLANPADFIVAGGTCSAGGSVVPGGSCTVSVAFKPSAGALGTRTGSLSIAHNAVGSPGSVSLSGNATAALAPVATLTSSLAFGSVNIGSTSTAQTATLSNTGTAPLAIGTLSTGSAEFTVAGGTCAAGGTVAVAASCSINLTFRPSTAGARSASLVVTHNAAGGQSQTSLAGTGVALSPVAGVSPATLNFSQSVGTTSVPLTVTVSNSGTAPLAISALTISGTQATEFQLVTGTTCTVGGNVAAAGSCVLKVTFTPAATGARTASLQIGHNAAGSPSTVALNGTATTAPQPAISLNASTLTFSPQTVGSASASQSVTVSNSGSAPLTLGALTLTGTAASDFTRSGTCAASSTLAVGTNCSVSFSFTPGAIGARSATLTIASDASNGNAVLSLAGTGAALPTPGVGLAPGSLAFGNQTVGVASTARVVTLTNTGSGALALSGISASAGFGVTHACGASLPAGANCALSITFTPTVAGTATGSVSVASNATGSPHKVGLSGTGVVASPVLAWLPAATSLDFGDAGVGAAPATRSLTLSNQGSGAVTLHQITLAGAQAADFSIGGGTCAIGAPLAQGATCTLAVDFQPGAAGARRAALQVTSSGTNPPEVALLGNGTALATPGVALVPNALSFNVPKDATQPGTQALILQSTGSAVLRVQALRVASGPFTIAAASQDGCPSAPFDLMPGQDCALAIGWSVAAPGSASGTLEIDTSAAAAPLQVAIQAAWEAPPTEPPELSNVGAGGCSIARGDTLADPTLWVLVLLAVAVLWRRRREG